MVQTIRQSEGGTASRDVPLPLKQTLRAAEVLLNLLPVATCICDPQGRIVQFNRRAQEIWGRTPRPGETHAHLTKASKYFRLDGNPVPHHEIPMSAVLATGKAFRDEELIVERPDGTRIIAALSIDPLLDSRGQLIGAVQCFQDITERTRMH